MPPRRPSLPSHTNYLAPISCQAGYDLYAIRRVWEQLEGLESQQPGQRRGLALTHPPTNERLRAFEVTLREIETKRRSGQPLDFSLEEAR